MKINVLKTVLLSTSLLLITPVVHANEAAKLDRYQVNSGLVKDLKTGLMWMRCSMGQNWDGTSCKDEAKRYTWAEAMKVPEKFEFAKYKDWRVPTRTELKSLVQCNSGQIWQLPDSRSQCDGDYQHPTLAHEVFPETPDNWFWTSSPEHTDWFWTFPFTELGGFAWVVNFGNGLDVTSDRDDGGHLRLVRTGK